MVTVYLNESQFSRLFLLEGSESLSAIYDKWYSDIDRPVFDRIVSSDPTYRSEKPDKMGRYGKWLLGLYRGGRLKLEDLYKATDYLSYFVKYYNRVPEKDITKYRDLPSLYDAVSGFMDAGCDVATSKSDEVRRIKSDVKRVYEDDRWLIIIPLTKEASIQYGKGTQWCTSAEHSENMYNYYNSKGDLYINIDKKKNRKYQFHFEDCQFMDERDREIEDPVSKTIDMDLSVVEKVYPFAVDTLTIDSSIHALGDGLYLNVSTNWVYRLFDDGSVRELLKVQGRGSCVKLCDGSWWFRMRNTRYGKFYDVASDSLYENEDYRWISPYVNRSTGEIFLKCIGSDDKSFVGKFADGSIKPLVTFPHNDYTNIANVASENSNFYHYPSNELYRYILLDTQSTDVGDERSIYDIFDIKEMKYVCKHVTFYAVDDSAERDCAVFRDAITNEEVERMCDEKYGSGDDGYNWRDSTYDDVVVINYFINNEADRYGFDFEDGVYIGSWGANDFDI